MRQLIREFEDDKPPFMISCKCGRKDCYFEFTDSGNVVIFCPSCIETRLLFRVKK